MSDQLKSKRELFDKAVKELNLDTRDPYTLLFANACALVDQRDALERELAELRAENEKLHKAVDDFHALVLRLALEQKGKP